jgi:hypothetical protein
MRQIVANSIQKLINKRHKMKDNKQLNQNQLIATKADKGKKLVILHKENNDQELNIIQRILKNNHYHQHKNKILPLRPHRRQRKQNETPSHIMALKRE